jgi:hypothetical protein
MYFAFKTTIKKPNNADTKSNIQIIYNMYTVIENNYKYIHT